MNHILYEASFRFQPVLLVPVVLMIFTARLPSIEKKLHERNPNMQYNETFVRYFSIGGFTFVATLSIIALLFQIHLYSRTVVAYRQGNYEIVEGYVENFDPMPYSGHKNESFDINGVSFSYSDFNIQSGYNKTRSHGGVIAGNGQHLKIGYVYYNSTYGNIIVYIEQLEQTDQLN